MSQDAHDIEECMGWFPRMTIYFSYGLLFLVGQIREVLDFIFCLRRESQTKEGYKPLTSGFDAFYRRRLYNRVQDCWGRPICSNAGPEITLMDRKAISSPETAEKEQQNAVNLGSYNYLGFASPGGPTEKQVIESLHKYGVSTTSPLNAGGRTALHSELEELVAEFLNTEDAMIFGMGWATNSTAIPSLVGKGCLILSDALNHNSIAAGCRASGAKTRVFKHNDSKDLENQIKFAIADGQPRTHIPWKKILIIVEGIYSMEGQTCPLKEFVEIKKKYKCYLYVDEAHSIGGLGKSGRGICEHAGVDTKDVDILMGTFTKSFGAIGGYVAGTNHLVSHLRANCASQHFSAGLSPVCVSQILGAFKIIMGRQNEGLGIEKIQQLHDNSNWFRDELRARGLAVLGDEDSAIIPVIIGHPAKIGFVSRECLKAGLAVVVVGFPATPLLSARVRFCISASHTKKVLEEVLEKFIEITTRAGLHYMA